MSEKKEPEKLKEEAPGECQACGGPLIAEKVNLEDYQGGKLYLMENVPAYACQECGEIWVPDQYMEEFEKMIKTVKEKRKETAAQKPKIRRMHNKEGKHS